ncbi:MAG TPA: (2Fe-2S) ferredoxin domain-containing protein [Armatimonadota bacterium]|jgi:NADP-reducing hydrogenase subunit HndB
MLRLKSVEELKKLREEAQRDMTVRAKTGTRIVIGMGTCGIAAGARETMHAILAELERLDIEAHVETVGCIGMCDKEPLVDIEQAGMPRVSYAGVTTDRVPHLLEEHLVKGSLVQEWAVGWLDSQPA